MTPAQHLPARQTWRNWPLWGVPARAYSYFLALECAALVWSALALSSLSLSADMVGRFVLLLALAMTFEEGAKKSAQLSLRLSQSMYQDMTAVWVVPGALILPAGMSVVFIVTLYTYMWFRQYRPSGRALYRIVLSVSALLIASLTANAVVGHVTVGLGAHGWSVTAAAAVAAGLVIYAMQNRGLITVSWVLRGVGLRELAGTWDENLIEYGTVCLGGLVAVTIAFEPWLTPLALMPMIPLQRSALVRKLEQVATTDSKTGLLNAVGWEHMAQRELTRAQREEASLAVLMIDLDWFKLVNDRHGHLAGDQVLKGLAELLTSEFRGYDSVGRFGGEEFVAVLPGVDDAGAVAVAERVRIRISATRISELIEADGPLAYDDLSVSIGVAVSPTDGSDLTELLHAADGALYAAKANGRNQVQLARRGGGAERPVASVI